MQSVKVVCSVLLVLCLCLISYSAGDVTVTNPLNAPDLPNFQANLRTVPAGSLIIPMDAATQVLDTNTGFISLLPYGLVIRTLYANVSVSWAIASGKPSSGADFRTTTQRATFASIANAQGQAAANGNWGGWSSRSTTTYLGGPFIILAQNVQKVITAWNSWKSNPGRQFLTVDPSVYDNVQIHYLSVQTVIDIRHTINTKPFVAVSNLNGNAPTQTAMLGCIFQNTSRLCPPERGQGWGTNFGNGQSGCKAFQGQDHAGLEFGIHYSTYDCGSQVAALTGTFCLATFSEPHWEWYTSTGPSYINALKQFVASGANFLAQCASVYSYENQGSTVGTGTFLTDFGLFPINATRGVNVGNLALNTITNYPDLPVTQYVGPMSSAMTGNIPDFFNLFSPSDDATGWSIPNTANSDRGYNNFKDSAFPLVTNIYDSRRDGTVKGRNLLVAAGAKANMANVLGSNVFYLGGHAWAGVTTAGTENGRRFLLNAIMIPAFRPAGCGFTFCTAGERCEPRNPCETCVCDASGSGFRYTPVADCCLTTPDCASKPCTACNRNQCTLVPGCCTSSITCPGSCQECANQNAQGIGSCRGTAGCCITDANCNSTSACVRCSQSSCVKTLAPTCCDVPADCTQTCFTCTRNVCARQLPLTGCCLSNDDCGANPCSICDTTTRQCVPKPGCCVNNTDCGTSPCVQCTTQNTCVRTDGCCEFDSQCGSCQQCSPTSNVCVASDDANCCILDSDCGSCRRCVTGSGGSKTCAPIPNCCITSADCEVCTNCTGNQCTRIDGCCSFDAECDPNRCQVCSEYKCVDTVGDLGCCLNNGDCTASRDYLRNFNGSNAAGNVSDCDYICQFVRPTDAKGKCQAFCSTPTSYTGLIVGLAVGVPLGLLALLAVGALIGLLIYKKRDDLTKNFTGKGAFASEGQLTNPTHIDAIQVGNNAAFAG